MCTLLTADTFYDLLVASTGGLACHCSLVLEIDIDILTSLKVLDITICKYVYLPLTQVGRGNVLIRNCLSVCSQKISKIYKQFFHEILEIGRQ